MGELALAVEVERDLLLGDVVTEGVFLGEVGDILPYEGLLAVGDILSIEPVLPTEPLLP